MDTVPSVFRSANSAERSFRQALVHAFDQSEGVLWTRYPIVPDTIRGRSEPDAILLLRDAGLFIFEVKGCRLDNVQRIEGPQWIMQDWYTSYEKPLQQVDRQMYAFRGHILAPCNLAETLPTTRRIVCPKISRAEWQTRFDTQMERRMLFAEDLAPDRLRQFIMRIGRAVSEKQYNAIRSYMSTDVQMGDQGSHAGPRIRRMRYDGRPPSPEQILDVTGASSLEAFQNGSYTYVTATVSLDMQRTDEGLVPIHQLSDKVPGRKGEEQSQLLFGNFLRHMLREAGREFLPGYLARLRLEEAMNSMAAGDEQFAQLRRDVYEWNDILTDLQEKGIDLSDAFPPELDETLVNPELKPVLQNLQASFHQRLQSEFPTLSQASRDFLLNDFSPHQSSNGPDTPTVVMEGFSFLRPLQQLFIKQCVQQDADLILIHAYREEQRRAFRVMERTYDLPELRDETVVDLETSVDGQVSDLQVLRQSLFDNQIGGTRPPFRKDGSVCLTEYEHLREEVQDVVASVRAALTERADDETTNSHDIVVVTRDLDRYRPQLVDEAELQAQEDDESNGIPSPLFREPPRKLLLTPTGLFILTLFDVYRDGFEMTPMQFSIMMNSGLLDAEAQDSTDAYEDIVGQVFTFAKTDEHWRRRLQQLEHIHASQPVLGRLPTNRLREGKKTQVVDVWKEAFRQIRQVGERLFDGGEYDIRSLIEKLQRELSTVRDADMLEDELTILRSIRQVLDELRNQAPDSKITMEQLGQVINGLIQEREDYDQERKEEEARRQGRVVITGPEGLDGSSQPITYFVGVDDQRVPGAYPTPWPFGEYDLTAHKEQQLYLFLAVVRATQEELHVSYAKVESTTRNRPSPYLTSVQDVWADPGIEFRTPSQSSETLVEAGEVARSPQPLAEVSGPPGKTYELAELIHNKLCQYRQKMEWLDPVTRTYRSDWQLQFLAQGLVLNRVFEKLLGQVIPKDEGPDAVFERFTDALKAVWNCPGFNDPDAPCPAPLECVRCWVPAFRDVEWTSVEEGVRKNLRNLADWYGKNEYELEVERAPKLRTKVTVDKESYTVKVNLNYLLRSGKVKYPIDSDLMHQEWLLPRGKKATDRAKEAFDEWRNAISTVYTYHHPSPITTSAKMSKFEETYEELQAELADMIRQVESVGFPKNRGDHCRYCSAQEECLGVVLPQYDLHPET